jgi:hypothetical protein
MGIWNSDLNCENVILGVLGQEVEQKVEPRLLYSLLVGRSLHFDVDSSATLVDRKYTVVCLGAVAATRMALLWGINPSNHCLQSLVASPAVVIEDWLKNSFWVEMRSVTRLGNYCQ